MGTKRFSVLYWNIWFDNQLKGEAAAGHLLDELEVLIETYQPDCICINEAVQHVDDSEPFIFRHLEKFDYIYKHFATSAPVTKEWLNGSAIASRIQPLSVQDVSISKDVPARRRGFGDHHTVKSIIAKIPMGDKQHINVMITHPLHLRGYNLLEHFRGTAKIRKLLAKPRYRTNTIIGGDFNEPRWMPGSMRVRTQHTMHFDTGTFLHPTWRHKAARWTPLRANLDQVYWSKRGNLHMRRFKVIRSHVSDHRPMYAEFDYYN